MKLFFKFNFRFVTPDQARKNRIIRPSKVLHFFGISKLTDQEMGDTFVKAGAALPTQVQSAQGCM